MKHNQPSETGRLADELAVLDRLDLSVLKQRWLTLYGTDAPIRLGRALLLHAVAYGLQEKALGGIKSSTRRLLERAAQDGDARRPTASTQTAEARSGTVLIREWHGFSYRVTVLEDGVLLRGKHYRSLSEVARKITGTRWSGPRFFGLRASATVSNHGTR